MLIVNHFIHGLLCFLMAGVFWVGAMQGNGFCGFMAGLAVLCGVVTWVGKFIIDDISEGASDDRQQERF